MAARVLSTNTALIDEATSAEKVQGVVGKAVLILRFLAERESVCSLTDLVTQLGLAKSTAHRLLCTLEVEGVVQRTCRGYTLCDRRLITGLSSDDLALLRRYTLKGMLWLYETTHMLSQLMVVEGKEVRCVEQFEPPNANILSQPLDFKRRWPTVEVAAGKAVLDSKAHIATVGRFVSRIAFDDGVTHRGLHTAAVPVIADGRLFAAISVSGSQKCVARAETQAALQYIARQFESQRDGLAGLTAAQRHEHVSQPRHRRVIP